MRELSARKELLVETLVAEAGKDPGQDRYHAGYIAAVNDFLNTDVVEETLVDD